MAEDIGFFVTLAFVSFPFSWMYFFIHYPMDVLFGAVLGILTAFVVCAL